MSTEKEAEIIVDIIDEEETADIAFDLLETLYGADWLEMETGTTFVINDTKETKFLRRCFFDALFPEEGDVMDAVLRYSAAKRG